MQHNSDKGWNGWGVDIWNSITNKNKLPELDKKTKEIISQIKETLDSGTKINFGEDFVGLTEIPNESLKEFLKTWDGSGDIMKQYQKHLMSTQKQQSAFSQVTQKAGTALKSFGATLGSMGVNMLIGAVVEAALQKIDSLTESTQDQIETLNSYKSTIQEYESEISSIEQKINDNKKQMELLNQNPLDIINSDTLTTLTKENEQLTQQLETVKLLNEEVKSLAQHKTMDILNNTAETTNWEKLFDGIQNLDISKIGSAYLGENGVYGDLINSFNNFKEGNLWEGTKDLADLALSINPFTGTVKNLYSLFKPQKENEQSITEETNNQIDKVAELRKELENLQNDREQYSKEDYDQKQKDLNKDYAEQTSSLLQNIQALKEYQASLDDSDPDQQQWIDDIQDTLDLYTASLTDTDKYNTFDKIINSEAYKDQKEALIELAAQGKLTASTFDEEFHDLSVMFESLGLEIDDVIDRFQNFQALTSAGKQVIEVGLTLDKKSLSKEFMQQGMELESSLSSLKSEYESELARIASLNEIEATNELAKANGRLSITAYETAKAELDKVKLLGGNRALLGE